MWDEVTHTSENPPIIRCRADQGRRTVLQKHCHWIQAMGHTHEAGGGKQWDSSTAEAKASHVASAAVVGHNMYTMSA